MWCAGIEIFMWFDGIFISSVQYTGIKVSMHYCGIKDSMWYSDIKASLWYIL